MAVTRPRSHEVKYLAKKKFTMLVYLDISFSGCGRGLAASDPGQGPNGTQNIYRNCLPVQIDLGPVRKLTTPSLPTEIDTHEPIYSAPLHDYLQAPPTATESVANALAFEAAQYAALKTHVGELTGKIWANAT
jgi:hypothetical protein